MRRRLGAALGRVHRRRAVHHRVVDAILGKIRPGLTKQPRAIRLVLAEQQRRISIAGPMPIPRLPVRQRDPPRPIGLHLRPRGILIPRPNIAKPHMRQNMQRRGIWPTVGGGDAHAQIIYPRLGVIDGDIEIAPPIKRPGVGQFKLALVQPARRVLRQQPRIGKLGLRILIQHRHRRMAGHAVRIVIGLLHILAVIALGIGEAEQALLQDRVAPVPQRQPQADMLLIIAKPANPVLAPAIGAAAGMVMRERGPSIPIRAVILAHGAPLPLGQIRPPAPPRAGFRHVGNASAFGFSH